MPTYEYVCKSCGHLFEIVQSMRDDPLTECPECGGVLRKVFAPPAISFKGSGFYATDQRKKPVAAGDKGSGDKGSGDKGSGDKGSGDKGSGEGGSGDKGSGVKSGESGSGSDRKSSKSDAPAASPKEASPSSSSGSRSSKEGGGS